jgi:hypothetical protein
LPSHYNLLLTRSVLHSCPSLFKYIFIVQRVFTMVFQLWIYCTLVSLTSSITLPYHSPILPITHSFQCILLCLLPTQKQCISILFTLYYSLLPHFFTPFSQSQWSSWKLLMLKIHMGGKSYHLPMRVLLGFTISV